MDNFRRIITADLDSPLVRQSVGNVMASGDALANRFGARITRSGQDVDVSAYTVKGFLIRPNEETIKIDGVANGNLAYVDLPSNCYVYDGAFTLTVKIYNGDGMKMAVAIFDGKIVTTTTETIIDGDRVLYGVEEILDLIDAMEQAETDASSAATAANTAAASANTATSKANTATTNANAATTAANTAADRANTAAQILEGGTVNNALALEGHPASYFLPATGTAADSSKLGGTPAANYALKAPNNYAYDGRDLSTIFTAEELHTAVAAGDFTNIRVGDYWPITLNGTIYDYAAEAEKTLSNAIIKLEVAGVNLYRQYGDTAVPNHFLFCSRDLLPWTLMFRSGNTTWYDKEATNPWLGSHLYQTLNASNGLLPLVAATDIGTYIYAGPNGNGMRFLGETKDPAATTATGWAWVDRGKLFLPSEREVWGGDTWSEHSYGGGVALQWPIFAGTMRHIIKGLGNGGGRFYWWCCSSNAGSSDNICYVSDSGYPSSTAGTADSWVGAPVCFLFV